MRLQENEIERGIVSGNVQNGFDSSSFYDWMQGEFDMDGGMITSVLTNLFDYAIKHCKGKDKLAHFITDIIGEVRFYEVARFCTNDILTKKTIKVLDSVCFDPDDDRTQKTVNDVNCTASPDGIPNEDYCEHGNDYFMRYCEFGSGCDNCPWVKITKVKNENYKPYYKNIMV